MAKKTSPVISNVESDVPVVDMRVLLTPIAILLSGLMVSISILFAFRDKTLTSATANTTANTNTTTTTQQTGATTDGTVDISSIKALFADGYIHFGNADAKNLLVEVSDPSCPYCHVAGGKDVELVQEWVKSNSQYSMFLPVSAGGTYVPPVPEMKKLLDEGKASFVYLYASGHGNGELAAQALYCANEKGKFWEVHDMLMSYDGYNLVNNTVKNDVANSGTLADFLSPQIDSSFMKTCLESKKYYSNLSRDENLAVNLGLSGTPMFFINTTRFSGAQSFSSMSSTVVN